MTDSADFTMIEQYRTYLLVIARVNLASYRTVTIDPNDLVQETLLKAQVSFGQFRGDTDAQLAGWLRSILLNQLTDHLRRSGRQLDEQALAHRMEESSVRLGDLLAAEQSSPSQHFCRQERVGRLAEALSSLPDDQQQAVEMRHLHGMALAEIAERMNKTKTAVAGLLKRGLHNLRENACQLNDESSR